MAGGIWSIRTISAWDYLYRIILPDQNAYGRTDEAVNICPNTFCLQIRFCQHNRLFWRHCWKHNLINSGGNDHVANNSRGIGHFERAVFHHVISSTSDPRLTCCLAFCSNRLRWSMRERMSRRLSWRKWKQKCPCLEWWYWLHRFHSREMALGDGHSVSEVASS